MFPGTMFSHLLAAAAHVTFATHSHLLDMDFFKHIPTHMDYEGQRKAERIFQTVILLSAVTGFVAGFVWERFSFTIITLAAGFLIASLLTLPPWPMYRTKPLKWQKSRSGDKNRKKN